MSCNACKKDCHKNETRCPLCNQATHKVISEEVYGMIKESVRLYVKGTHFHLCDNEDCEVVFHSADLEDVILTQDINKFQLQPEEKSIESDR